MATTNFDPNNPLGSGMVLTFDDEFNSLSASSNGPANGTVWTQINGNPNLSVHNGVLDIASINGPNGFTGGELISTNQQGQGFGQKFGYFEARIQCSVSGGSFVMFSQAHAQNGAAPAAELDVLESDPGGHPTDILATLHSNSASSSDQANLATGGNPFVDVGVPLAAGFHTYSALWDPNASTITWYFDGRAVMVQPKFSTTDLAPMLLDIQGGIGLQQGAPQAAGEVIPNVNHVYVDYVRAWQFSSQNPTAVTPQAVSNPFGQVATNGSTLPGQAPLPTPSPVPVGAISSDGSSIVAGSSGQLVTSDGTWMLGSTAAAGGDVILLNGQTVLDGAAVKLLVTGGGHLFADNAQSVWYEWSGSSWNQTTAPVPTPAPAPAPAPVAVPAVGPTVSADGSSLVAGSSGHLVTSDGTWALSSTAADGGNVITLNGQSALDGAAVELVVAGGGHLFADNAQGVWYEWSGSAWNQTTAPVSTPIPAPVPAPVPAPAAVPTVSADGSSLTAGSSGHLVTSDGTWALGSTAADGGNVITLNGQSVLDGAAVKLVVADGGHLFADNAQGVWYEWSGSSWNQTTNPVPAPVPAPAAVPTVSADGSSLAAGSSGHLVTIDGIWSFSSTAAPGGDVITLNGQTVLDGAAVKLVVAGGGHLFADNAQGVWYEWSGLAWNQTTNPMTGSTVVAASTLDTTTHAALATSGTSTAPADMFVFTSLQQQGSEIPNFDPSHDVVDLIPLLKAIGYTGTDPLADHIVTLAASGTDSTAVMIDPTGHAANHGQVLVTLDHVLPQSLHPANFLH